MYANYRPITNLSTIGKILERLAMKQMRSHMEDSPNLDPQQSEYRALHSTETAMTRVMNDLLSAKYSKSPSVLLSLDISAAFDTLDHQRLLEWAKELFGFDSVVLRWLGSYLAGREQFVGVDGRRSRTVRLSSGVPQGSVLGPLLFSIFTTPVGNLISTFGIRYHQFADDTQLYTVINALSPNGLATPSACADAVIGWHIRNNLLLNPMKTEAIVTGTRQQVTRLDQSGGVTVSGVLVPLSSRLRVVGVTLDSQLSFDEHITIVEIGRAHV